MDALIPIFGIVRTALHLYSFLVLASVLLSWFTFGGADHPSVHRAQELLHTATEPFLGPLRQAFMPITMRIGLDFSPMLGIFILNRIAQFLPY
ncbi:hypothetical protein CMK11_04730 [Candidatus Poribacteria bacterium]|nr:hypothetical protein [Candidatus Poribacteria bacterium]